MRDNRVRNIAGATRYARWMAVVTTPPAVPVIFHTHSTAQLTRFLAARSPAALLLPRRRTGIPPGLPTQLRTCIVCCCCCCCRLPASRAPTAAPPHAGRGALLLHSGSTSQAWPGFLL
ncbi:hypothetical protein EON67_08845 [archaeon]|nr:MAG: hypothetical protein EON67_08845 [archaeon]